MQDRAPEKESWSPRKWGVVIFGFFIVQLALIFVFSEYHRAPSKKQRSRPNIHLLTAPVTSRQLAKSFFASDPTLFASVSLHSFSGPAWLRIEPPEYVIPDRDTPIRWLDLDIASLGSVSDASLGRLPPPLQPGMLAGPKIEQFPFLRMETQVRTQSIARVVGPLASRVAELPECLPSWPAPTDLATQLVGTSIIEIAADDNGEVISAHVSRLGGRCGLDAADAEALRIARTLHFMPVARSASSTPKLTWGKLIVEWQTQLLPETNSAAAKPL